jgi:PAS domain S-box-containing protein
MPSENVYRDILENLHDGVYFVDAKRRITFWNKGAERISG